MPLKRIKAQPRTPEEIAEEQRVRELFEDRPSVETSIERGEIDPERIMTGTAEESLLKASSTLSRGTTIPWAEPLGDWPPIGDRPGVSEPAGNR